LAKKEIEDKKKIEIEQSKARMEQETKKIQKEIRLLAVLLPPIPAFLLGLLVFFLRLSRERQTIPKERWVKV
jgi:ABC-2 type transport system permease protein